MNANINPMKKMLQFNKLNNHCLPWAYLSYKAIIKLSLL